MSKSRIPIQRAKDIGSEHDFTHVIIVAYNDQSGQQAVCTWGKTLANCEHAAQGGNAVKRLMGWPEELCQAKPARQKRKEASRDL